MNYAVETEELTKKFPRVLALEKVSLQVPKGVVFALVGPNGSGKTTFLKLLLGLFRPTSGKGLCLGLDIVSQSQEIREKTGFINEETSFYSYMKVRELLDFCRGLYPRWNDELVNSYLNEFGIPSGERIKNLSYGLRNQLALLIALAPGPEILFLDEPTSGLDPIFKRLFMDTILAEAIGKGKTVLIATHQLNDVEKVADYVAFLYQGRMIEACPLAKLKARFRKIRAVFQVDPPPHLLSMEGVAGFKRKENTFYINTSHNPEKILNACSNVPHFSLEVTELNLEDIFFLLLESENGVKIYQ